MNVFAVKTNVFTVRVIEHRNRLSRGPSQPLWFCDLLKSNLLIALRKGAQPHPRGRIIGRMIQRQLMNHNKALHSSVFSSLWGACTCYWVFLQCSHSQAATNPRSVVALEASVRYWASWWWMYISTFKVVGS